VLCQEQQSVIITSVRGLQKAAISLWEGMIVTATCGELVGEEAIYNWLCWESGQFDIIPLVEPPDLTEVLAPWEELVLEAAQQRDEHELSLPPPLQPFSQHHIDAMLAKCPDLQGLALVSYDGLLLGARGIPDTLLPQMTTLVLGLARGVQILDTTFVTIHYHHAIQPFELVVYNEGTHFFVVALPSSYAQNENIAHQLQQCFAAIAIPV